MDFTIPAEFTRNTEKFDAFIKKDILPHLPTWSHQEELPRTFFQNMGSQGWFGLTFENGCLKRESALKESLITEKLARISPGTAIGALAHVDLGLICLFLFGSPAHQRKLGKAAVEGKTVMCLGNTENIAGSDVAGIGMQAAKTEGGWILNGTKAYVTNGWVADWGVITAVSDPDADRKRRLSMYLVDLNNTAIRRKKLNKQVWIPSDLTRLSFSDVFVPDNHLLGKRGRGLHQVLEIFTNSRVSIAALTLGTAAGAFDLAVEHMQKRKIFGKHLMDFQAKAFETSNFYAKLESARLMLHKACWLVDQGEDFQQASSLAKYLSVEVAREVTLWAADIFGAASVIREHPIHKFPMDVWGASLGEGTQDVQKLIIFRQLMKKIKSPTVCIAGGIMKIDMQTQIIYAKKISFQEENKLSPQIMKNYFHTAIEINNILDAENKRVAYFFIDPLLDSFEAANRFYFGILKCNTIRKINTYKTGAGPIQAITDAGELIKNDLYDAIFIFGHEPLLSDTRNYGRETIKKAMEIFEDFSLIECYDLLSRQLCRETDISNDEFRELADSLFNNYARTFRNKSGTPLDSSRGKVMHDLGTDLFCLTDCANPNIDFAGGLIVANNCTAEQLKIPKDRRVQVSGSKYSIVKGSPKAIDSITGKDNNLFPHLKEAFLRAQAESQIDIIQEFQNKNLLLEAYTCYPPIPIALLLATGFVNNINKIGEFLKHHEITVTGGMNIARAPWNNPALNGLIEVTELLVKGNSQYGMVHGNGGIGEAQGITVLERPYEYKYS